MQKFCVYEDKVTIASVVFFDLLSFYFLRYFKNNIELLQLSFIFNFLNDFVLNIIINFYFILPKIIKPRFIQLKQFKYFFHSNLNVFDYYKFYNLYNKNYPKLYLEV